MVISGVHKRFGALAVLRGVDLALYPAEILALVGENGAGKSTLVRCIDRSSTADAGLVELRNRADPGAGGEAEVAVVWQDLALCDNLSVIANLFLGGERVNAGLLDEVSMLHEARSLFDRLGITVINPLQLVGTLSGGQRQLVAIARAVRRNPSVIVLDEPTAALGVGETRAVEQLLAQLRDGGAAILLVSHRLEQVFHLADRIAVLRGGRIVADVSRLEVHPDDIAALISGVEVDSTARRQLRRLHSLVEQLAEVEPSASLPLIVSALAEAVAVDRLCIHQLVAGDDGAIPATAGRLRRAAAVGFAPHVLGALDGLPVGAAGGPPGLAAETGEVVVVEDVRRDGRGAGAPEGVRSCWSIPVTGSAGVLGTISGYADAVGSPPADQLELMSLYAGYAAAAIEREALLADATRRNRMLETLRGVLDTLAGPQSAHGGLAVALLALCRGLGADSITVHEADGVRDVYWATEVGPGASAIAASHQREAAMAVFGAGTRLDRARPVGNDVLAVPIAGPAELVVVTAWWADAGRLTNDSVDLLDDAARSLRLALERQALEDASAEAASLRQSQRMQREFLSLLNHELRTPLTAIQGYASTLRQTDISWDELSQQRFLDSIASESARMGRLVGDLLDFSAIDSGTLRLQRDWCDLALVLEAARRCVTEGPPSLIAIRGGADLPPIWADHDRLEQVFVNLLENAVRHASASTVDVSSEVDADGHMVRVRVVDDGRGIPVDLAERVFLPRERGPVDGRGAGLGLAIAKGIVEAHGGAIDLEPVALGTSVVVVLPAEPVADDATEAVRW
jgi:signal transduction histidine kinase/ABC-type multidrug transport system ATPase subunit